MLRYWDYVQPMRHCKLDMWVNPSPHHERMFKWYNVYNMFQWIIFFDTVTLSKTWSQDFSITNSNKKALFKTRYLKRAFSLSWKFYTILLIFKITLNTNNLYLFYELILNPQHFNNNWTASFNSSSGIPAKPKTILGGFSCFFSNE